MFNQTVAILSLVLALNVCASQPARATNGAEGAPVSAQQEDSENTILHVAAAAGSFKTLLAAIEAAELVVSVNSPGPLTVFAPTDAAFAKLPAGTVESLLLPENRSKLVNILTYHVIPGAYTAAEVMQQSSLPTAAGKSVSIKKANGGMVGGAKIIKKDIQACNGVIHVIDKVLLP